MENKILNEESIIGEEVTKNKKSILTFKVDTTSFSDTCYCFGGIYVLASFINIVNDFFKKPLSNYQSLFIGSFLILSGYLYKVYRNNKSKRERK